MPYTVVKLALLTAFLSFHAEAITNRAEDLGLSLSLAAYIALFAMLSCSLAAAAFISNVKLRAVLAVAFAGSSALPYAYEAITGSPLDYNAFETMLASRGDLGDAFTQSRSAVIVAALAAATLFIAIILPSKAKPLPLGLNWLLPIAAIVGLGGVVYARGGEGARGLPSAFPPLAYSAIKVYLALDGESGARKAVEIAPIRAPAARDIVLIVDESIAAKYLDINDAEGVFSGLATPPPAFARYNYGVAASVSNCSVGSNRSLRFGGMRSNYRATSKQYPSIWAYARAAGLRTVYLDGQRNNGELQNLMSPEEQREIDDFVQLDGVPVIERDQKLGALLAERIGNDQAELIYVNKVGAHFPVADKFPLSHMQFRPTPERGEAGRNIPDMRGPVHGGHSGATAEWRLYRNAYRNTLTWNVGAFFQDLLGRIDPANAVIIYTADHGQDLHETGRPGKGTHCSSAPSAEEGAVPLVVLDSAAAPSLAWGESLAANRNGMSHFRIFPTILELMGYSPQQISPLYGPSLIAPAPDDMAFTIDYFSSLGRSPTWRRIDVEKLARPPRSDFEPHSAPGRPDQGGMTAR